MGLIELPGYVLVFLGAVPIGVMTYYEKHYTKFYTALWNLYGIALVVLGLLTDANTAWQIIISLVASLVLATIAVFLLKTKKYYLIPKIGASGYVLAGTILVVGSFYFSSLVIYVVIISIAIIAAVNGRKYLNKKKRRHKR